MDSILGSWKLVSFKVREIGGDISKVQHPYGTDVSGTLIYEQQGYMCEIIAGNSRPRAAAVDTKLMLDEEKMAIAENFRGFSGTFEVQVDKILHHIHVSFLPRLAGTTQEKNFCFEDEKLVIREPQIRFGEKLLEPVTIWERAS